MTLEDLVKFQKEHIKDCNFTYCILGDEKTLDFNAMATYGKIKRISLEDIFGY